MVTSAMIVPSTVKTPPTNSRCSEAAWLFDAQRKPQATRRGRAAVRKSATAGAAAKVPGSGGGGTRRASPSARTQQAQSAARSLRSRAAQRPDTSELPKARNGSCPTAANPARNFAACLPLPRRRPARRQVMETGTARYGPVRRVVWGPEANYLRLPDSASSFLAPQ